MDTVYKRLKATFALAPLLFWLIPTLAACSSQSLMYRWGAYESALYDMYLEPGKSDAQAQIDSIEDDIQISLAEGKAVAPGVYAHLAMLYLGEGRSDLARQALLREKELFPESAVFVDRLLDREEES